MFLLTTALAQDCAIDSAVAAYPLGSVPEDAVHWAVVRTDCDAPLSAIASVYDEERLVGRFPTTVTRDGAFAFFRFEVRDVPLRTELFLDIDVRVADETRLYLGGFYQVDPDQAVRLEGVPELGDLRVERSPVGPNVEIEASAAVLPATTGPEAFLLWRSDQVLRAVTVSTQPRPTLVWTEPAPADRICIEVEEVGVDGSSASSDPHCTALPVGASGCSTVQVASPRSWWMFVAGRRRG